MVFGHRIGRGRRGSTVNPIPPLLAGIAVALLIWTIFFLFVFANS